MTIQTFLTVITLMGLVTLLFPAIVYWEECSEGRPHESSLTISSILIGLFVGSNFLDYAAVVTMNS
jgi:hypothetical protein